MQIRRRDRPATPPGTTSGNGFGTFVPPRRPGTAIPVHARARPVGGPLTPAVLQTLATRARLTGVAPPAPVHRRPGPNAIDTGRTAVRRPGAPSTLLAEAPVTTTRSQSGAYVAAQQARLRGRKGSY
jgi:hypothetical protein